MKFRLFPLMESEGDGGGSGGSGGGDQNHDPKRTAELLHLTREEAKAWRLKYQEAETARKASDEKATAAEAIGATKLKEAQTAADHRVILAELKAAGLKAGMADMDFLKLVDVSKVKLGEDGEVIGADELMASLKKSKPLWFGTPSTSSTHDTPKPVGQKDKKVSEMTDKEREAEAKKRGFSGKY